MFEICERIVNTGATTGSHRVMKFMRISRIEVCNKVIPKELF